MAMDLLSSKRKTTDEVSRQKVSRNFIKRFSLGSNSSLDSLKIFTRYLSEDSLSELRQSQDEVYKRTTTYESKQIINDLSLLLEKISRNLPHEIIQRLYNFEQIVYQTDKLNLTNVILMFDNFYFRLQTFIKNNLFNHDQNLEFSSTIQRLSADYLTNQLYSIIYPFIFDESKHIDEAFNVTCSTLQWINLYHLNTSVDISKPELQRYIDLSITELLKVNVCVTISSKMQCILNCSHYLHEALQQTGCSQGAADDFLPLLIFTLIRANPLQLKTNISYLEKFSYPGYVYFGEVSYYFTSLVINKKLILK